MFSNLSRNAITSLTMSMVCFLMVSAEQAQAANNKPIPIAAAKIVNLNFAPTALKLASEETLVRGASGASFIKLHFTQFKLPFGAVLEVSDASGQEVYRYTAEKLGPHTVEAKLGENGKTSFAAMSVNGEVARVRLILNGAKWNSALHGVRVGQIMEGFSESKIASALRLADASPQDVGTTSICGVNERKDAICYASSNPAEFERSRPVARLVLGGGLCTTWRVGNDNHLITNNHCIATQAEAAASEVWFNYQKTSCGGSVMAPVTKVNAVTMLKTDATLDYTLYTVSDFATIASFGNFGLDVRTPVKDEQIFIPQHGAGNPKELAITSDSNAGGVCRIDVPVQDGMGSNTDAGYKCDTVGGSSGSPVVATISKRVIALHHLGGCPSTNNSGALISKIWPQITSYFNNVVPIGDNGTPPPVTTPISANVAATNLTGTLGKETFYELTLASAPSTLRFTTSSGTGDLNLYVKQGSLPSTASSDCKSETVGNVESCNIAAPVAGKYYVLLKGYAAYSGASLLAATSTSIPSLVKDIPVAFSGATGATANYTFTVPSGVSNLTFKMSGGTGDGDIYTKLGSAPTTTSYLAKSNGSTNTETITIAAPAAGTYHLLAVADAAVSGASVVASYSTSTGNVLTSGVPVAIALGLNTSKVYSIVVPAGKTSLTFTLSGGTGDGDLYAKMSSAPTTTSYTKKSDGGTNTETITFSAPAAGTYYVLVNAYAAVSGASLKATIN